jgi:hypothetical protein
MGLFDSLFGKDGGIFGAGLSAVGGLLGGSSSNKSQSNAIGAQERQARQNRLDSYGFLRSAISGDTSVANAQSGAKPGYPAAIQREIDRLTSIMNDPSVSYKAARKASSDLAGVQSLNPQQQPLGAVGLSGERELLGQDRDAALAQFAALMQGNTDATNRTRQARQGMGDARGIALQGVADANQYGVDARTAANTAYESAIKSGQEDISRQLAGLGLGGSTVQANNESALRSRGAAGLAEAMAGIEGNKANLLQNARGRQIGAEESYGASQRQFEDADLQRQLQLLAQQFGLGQDYRNQILGTYSRANNLVAGQANPNATYQNVNYGQSLGGNIGQNIAGSLGSVGGQVLGASLGGGQLASLLPLLMAG